MPWEHPGAIYIHPPLGLKAKLASAVLDKKSREHELGTRLVSTKNVSGGIGIDLLDCGFDEIFKSNDDDSVNLQPKKIPKPVPARPVKNAQLGD